MKPELIPKNPAHQRVADLWLSGVPIADAYKQAGYRPTTKDSAQHAGQLILRRKDVKTYVAAVQMKAAEKSVATVAYKRELLFKIMDTPLLAIDPDDKALTHGRLIKKFKRVTSEFGETYEIEKHCPLKAMEIDNKLSGDDPETNALADLAQAIAALAPSTVLPTGKL